MGRAIVAELHDSYRDSPKVPAGWRPRDPPGAVFKEPINNFRLMKLLQSVLPGRWTKVYHYSADGSEVHYCQHESGKVFDVKFKPRRSP
jgi:hypothetical protein